MGGGYYYDDVRTARASIGTTRRSDAAFEYHTKASTGEVNGVHPDLDIKGKIREACDSADHPNSTPIAVAMDVTSSRGRDARVIYEQVPSFLGSLQVSGVVPDPQIMWLAIGDANADRAPLQVSQFESDRRIDEHLRKIWMEEGGGGTGEESYELGAYVLAEKTKLDVTKRGKRGFAFFLGDEAPYPTVSKVLVGTHIGDKLKDDLPTKQVFKALQKKFDTFLIFPGAPMEERKAAIDTEIRRRLEAAGGRFREVDIRASLIWHTRDDLDLHCETPGGFHIYYGSKRADCRGELDVDRNVSGEDPKPVENIRWAKGDARNGQYRFWVELYRHHERPAEDIPFAVELDVQGEIKRFEGVIPKNHCHKRFIAFEFHFAPGKVRDAKKVDAFAEYQDEVVLAKWSALIPPEQILRIKDPASAVECMLGAMALRSGSFDLDAFMANMKERRVAKATREDVQAALVQFAKVACVAEAGNVFA